MIFYSAEARGYQLMIVLVMLSTLALLAAVERAGTRWWVAYAPARAPPPTRTTRASSRLAAQLAVGAVGAPGSAPRRAARHRRRRRRVPAVAAGVRRRSQHARQPDHVRLQPGHAVHAPARDRALVGRLSVPQPTSELRDLPGVVGLSLEALGLAIGVAGAAAAVAARRPAPGSPASTARARARRRDGARGAARRASGAAVGTNLLAARNLAVSWPWFALLLAAVLVAAGPRLGLVAAALVIAGFTIGGVEDDRGTLPAPGLRGARPRSSTARRDRATA